MAPIDARKKLEQIRKNKAKNGKTNSTNNNVKDLRQIISKKSRPKPNERSANKAVPSRVTNNRASSLGGVRDLRETNKKLSSRRNLSQTREGNRSTYRDDRLNQGPGRVSYNNNNNHNNINNTVDRRLTRNASYKNIRPTQQYYIPPHIQHQQQPTYIIAPAAQPSNLAMDQRAETQGASVLISNLMPTITQSEIIELFGDIGVMTAVNMINTTTALVTYQNSSDAVRAVKVYHNRLLDGKPMLVNMMPNAGTSTNIRSRIGQSSIIL